MVNFF